jgi:regulator of protease activity HflC (stomatin/prohibitin superfamily)
MKHSYSCIAGILCLILTVSGCMVVSTGSTEVGVRTKKIGLNRGIEQTTYAPGSTYFFLPIINDFNTFDTRLVNLEMTFDPSSGDKRKRDDLLFKTIDGNDISLDVIISYRVNPEKAPYILEYIAKSDQELKDILMRTIARSRPRDIFGELSTEEFYVAEKRDEKAQKALDILNEIMDPYGVIIEKVMTRDYRFNPAYQKAIEDKKVADQNAEKNKSSTRAALEEYLKKLEEAKGDVAKMKAEIDGKYLQAKIEADAYYAQQQKIALAIEAEGKADARAIEEMNKALAGSGGETIVKLKIAEALADKKILLLPTTGSGIDFRTLDMNSLILGNKALPNQSQKSN